MTRRALSEIGTACVGTVPVFEREGCRMVWEQLLDGSVYYWPDVRA
jgi:hypothetical protein